MADVSCMQTFDGERCLYGALNNAVRQQLRKAGFQRAGKHLEAASYSLSSCLVIDKVVLLPVKFAPSSDINYPCHRSLQSQTLVREPRLPVWLPMSLANNAADQRRLLLKHPDCHSGASGHDLYLDYIMKLLDNEDAFPDANLILAGQNIRAHLFLIRARCPPLGMLQ